MARLLSIVVAAFTAACGSSGARSGDAPLDASADLALVGVDGPGLSMDAAVDDLASRTPPDVGNDRRSPEGLGFQLRVTPSSVDFRAVWADTCTKPHAMIDVNNAGGGPTSMLQAQVMGDFVISQDSCAGRILAPAASCVIVLEPHPSHAGQLAGVLSLTGTPAADRVSVALSAQAFADDNNPTITPIAADFGDFAVGVMSAASTFTVWNPGEMAVDGIEISVSTGEFVIENDQCTGTSVPANGNCSFDVAFRPQSAGLKSAVLSVSGKFCAQKTFTVAQLTGRSLF